MPSQEVGESCPCPIFHAFTPHSSGLIVAASLGGRADLAPKLTEQFEKAVRPIHLDNARQHRGNPAVYRSYGCNLAIILQAAP